MFHHTGRTTNLTPSLAGMPVKRLRRASVRVSDSPYELLTFQPFLHFELTFYFRFDKLRWLCYGRGFRTKASFDQGFTGCPHRWVFATVPGRVFHVETS